MTKDSRALQALNEAVCGWPPPLTSLTCSISPDCEVFLFSYIYI